MSAKLSEMRKNARKCLGRNSEGKAAILQYESPSKRGYINYTQRGEAQTKHSRKTKRMKLTSARNGKLGKLASS